MIMLQLMGLTQHGDGFSEISHVLPVIESQTEGVRKCDQRHGPFVTLQLHEQSLPLEGDCFIKKFDISGLPDAPHDALS
jgi:hypothetical protein